MAKPSGYVLKQQAEVSHWMALPDAPGGNHEP